MHQPAADQSLADSLVAIRSATNAGTIEWVAVQHPITGEIIAYKGVGENVGNDRCDDETAHVYMLDDDYIDDDNPDIEDGPSITRYLDDKDKHFDAMILAKFSEPAVQDSLAKLLRLVRKVTK
jgi:hypothetical protein